MPRRGHPRHVIVGVQGGESTPFPASAALNMHQRFGTHVEFVHAVDLPRPEDVAGRPYRVSQMEAEIESAAFQQVGTQLEELASQGGYDYPVRDHLLVSRGRPAQVLVSRAQEAKGDLILLGPPAKRGLLDFGSTTRAVLGKSSCDVWVQPCAQREIRNILVPTDLSEESRLAMESATAMAAECGAKVTMLHCFVPPDVAYAASSGYPMAGPVYVVEDVRKELEREFVQADETFDWQNVEHERRFVEGRPAQVILDLQDEFDLIAMGSHGRTGLAAAVLGNVAYAVLKEATTPVFAIRHPDRSMLLG